MRKKGKNMKRILTLLLAIVIGLGVLPPVQARAAEECTRPWNHAALTNEYKYERVSDEPFNGVRSYRLCSKCKEWVLVHDAIGDPDKGHQWKVVQKVPATCTTDGYDLYQCWCGLEEKANIVKATGHRFGDWKVVKAAACLEAGERQHECEECHTVEKEAIPAKGAHSFGEWKVVKEASCTEAGERQRECGACHTIEKEAVPVVEHEWTEWKETKKAACTEAGEEMRSCESCKKEEKRELAAKGHSFGEWTVAKAASCKEAGQEKRTCAVCKTDETREIAKSEHQWGAWTVTKQAGHGENGEEERTCKVCKEKETRVVDGDKPLAQAGSKGLAVLITQHLLTMGGEYAGETDGVMNEALADAIRVFEAANGFPETGVIYADTLQLLNERYLASFEGVLPRQGMLNSYASGLRTRLQIEDHCTSNEDGTHKNAAVVTGVQYLYGEEDMTLSLPQDKQHSFPEITESCAFMNDALTCTKCGYRQNFAWMFENGIGGIGGPAFYDYHEIIYLNTTEDLGLGNIENIAFDEPTDSLHWTPVEGAFQYHIVITGDGETVLIETKDARSYIERSFWHGLGEGQYIWYIQALDSDGMPRSNKTCFSWYYDGHKMPAPEGLSFQYAMVRWSFPYDGYEAKFRVNVSALTPSGEGYDEELLLETETENEELDVSALYFKNTLFPYGTQLKVSVQTIDATGKREDADPYETLVPYVRPDFLKAEVALNVRAGAGESYERIGSIKAGSCMLCWDHVTGDDGNYVLIGYDGYPGYVKRNFLSWFQPADFEVTVDLSDGRVVDVRVNIDGTLNMDDFKEKVKKHGHKVAEIKKRNGDVLQEGEVLIPDTRLKVEWVLAGSYYQVTFIRDGKKIRFTDPDTGKEQDYVILYGGGRSKTEMPEDVKRVFRNAAEKNAYWCTEKNGQGTIVTENTRRITEDMRTLYWCENSEQDFTLGEVPDLGSEIYREAKMDSSIRIGFLQRGDRIRILDTVVTGVKKEYTTKKGEIEYTLDFYKIYHYRLDTEGYILTRALERAGGVGRFPAVYFDANGGWCTVQVMTAKRQNEGDTEEDGYLLRHGALPTAARDGYIFLGWFDQRGKRIHEDYYRFKEKSTTLTAKWQPVSNTYASKTGVLVPDRSKGEFVRQGIEYYFNFDGNPDQGLRRPGEKVTVIDELGRRYCCVLEGRMVRWIDKENVCVDYRHLNGGELYAIKEYEHSEIGYIEGNGGLYIVGDKVKINGKKCYPVVYDSGVAEIEDQKNQGDIGCGYVVEIPPKKYGSIYLITEQWTDYDVYFDANGGYCDIQCLSREDFPRYITPDWLPVATQPGKKFLGWFTEPVGGRQFVNNEIFTGKTMTVYAHWEDKNHEKKYYSASKKDHVFQNTNAHSPVLASVEPGDVVLVLEGEVGIKGDGYVLVSAKGQTGYLNRDSLLNVELTRMVARIESGAGRSGASLNRKYMKELRKFPDKNKKVRNVKEGEEFFVFSLESGRYPGWASVSTPEGENGTAYVWSDALRYE